jgi:hypothetical protein
MAPSVEEKVPFIIDSMKVGELMVWIRGG